MAAELSDLRAELNHVYRLVVLQGSEIARLSAHAQEITEAEPALAAPPPAPAPEPHDRPEEPSAHVLFKPAATGGYELLERDGRPPVEGETVEIDGRRFVAARLGPSPLPGDGRVCAYLYAE
jgi:hypothetical protein